MRSPSFRTIVAISCMVFALDIACNYHQTRTFSSSFLTDDDRNLRANKKNYNIMVFGGSVTWGASINRSNSYSELISRYDIVDVVRNLAIRDTGAEYPRYCLESMIGTDDNVVYDVIVLEFSLNGYVEMGNLMGRLKRRYPDAIFIYIDLYSLREEIVDEANVKASTRGISVDVVWRWGMNEKIHAIEMDKVRERLEATHLNVDYLELPRKYPPIEGLDMFSEDWHYLSEHGHKVVADLIKKKLDKERTEIVIPRLGNWGVGDKCSTKKYNIMVFGGSVTWGSNIDRSNSYSELISRYDDVGKVRNLAIRATGAEYPCYCLESMVGTNDDVIYDVIILEFSLNGSTQTKNLIKRLKTRYPDAMFMYIDLYSLREEIVDPTNVLARNRVQSLDTIWHWGLNAKRHAWEMDTLMRLLKEDNLKVEHLELPRKYPPIEGLEMFSEDWHHLSEHGHKVVADLIKKSLDKKRTEIVISRLGNWGVGDKCVTWYENGEIGDIDYSNADLKEFSPSKHAIEFLSTGSITFQNPYSHPKNLYINFMVKSSFYPKTQVFLENDSTATDVSTVSPRRFHEQVTKKIGVAYPGKNVMKVIPTDDGAPWPFRLTGVVMEGVIPSSGKEVLKK